MTASLPVGTTEVLIKQLREVADSPHQHSMLCGPPERSCFRPSCQCSCHRSGAVNRVEVHRNLLHAAADALIDALMEAADV